MKLFTKSRFAKISAIALVTFGLLATPPLTANAVSNTTQSGWLHTSGSKILTSNNTEYNIKAISWFGLETSNCTPHGLWSISLDSGLKKIKDAGFNTIRLPYSNECINTGTANSINYAQNPSLVGKKPIQIMDTVVSRAKSYGLNIILDRHRPDSGAQSELWYTSQYSESKWIADWKMLANRYKSNPTVIGFDLHNEPHGNACWGCGDTKRDWSIAAKKAGDAVLSVNSKLLIIVEGVERQADNSTTWWGGGLQGVKKYPVKLKVPNRVVYSPHEYPSTVYNQTWFNASNYPNNLPAIWDKNWGYIQKSNIAPVLVGEFGTKYQTDSDKKWLSTLVNYMKTNKMSYAYWSFNPNSGDTGGIMKDDWTTYETAKLKALAPILNPKSNTSPTVPLPVPTPKPTSPVATPKPTTTPATKFKATYKLQSSWSAGYVAGITASGKAKNWTVSWTDANATSIASAWGMKCSLSNKVITCKGSDWGINNLAYGQAVNAGVQVNVKSGKAPTAPVLKVSSN